MTTISQEGHGVDLDAITVRKRENILRVIRECDTDKKKKKKEKKEEITTTTIEDAVRREMIRFFRKFLRQSMERSPDFRKKVLSQWISERARRKLTFTTTTPSPSPSSPSSSSEEEEKAMIASLLDYYFPPWIAKDLPVYRFHLGEPISYTQALSHFREPDIRLDRLSPFKRSAFAVSDKRSATTMLYDPILMEQVPSEDMVQLKVDGELLSKEMFVHLCDSHRTTWCGKPNVGFKSPSGVIYGNLVLYNYDHADFFPQKPGTLSIRRIANRTGVPCQQKPVEMTPTHYFELSYSGYVFFLPDTKEGVLVLCLMKDAFKKGNLFAFSARGSRPRHGRVHKKTALEAGPYRYGFPDDTYLERVTSELNALGSSPYLYQFSQDPSFTVELDPYPKETRFRISVLP